MGRDNYNKILFIFFRLIIFSVFISFVYIAVKYIYNGNLRFMGKTNVIDSLICAYGFSLMSIVAFDMAVYYFTKKKLRLFFIFTLLYIILFAFNVGTILYYKNFVYQDKIVNSSENLQYKKDTNKHDNIMDKINRLKNDQVRIQAEYERQFKILQTMKEDDKEYAFYYWNINKANTGLSAQLNKISNELNKLNDEKNNIEINSDVLQTNKRELFAGTLLLLYLFLPAFIIELLASICLALLLFINWDTEKKVKKVDTLPDPLPDELKLPPKITPNPEIIPEAISIIKKESVEGKKESEEKIKEVIKIQEVIKEVENPVNIDLAKKNEELNKQLADIELNKKLDKLRIDKQNEKINILESNLKRFGRH